MTCGGIIDPQLASDNPDRFVAFTPVHPRSLTGIIARCSNAYGLIVRPFLLLSGGIWGDLLLYILREGYSDDGDDNEL